MAALAAVPAYAEILHIDITNQYKAQLDFGPLGGGRRAGKDTLVGDLTKQPDGSFQGVADAEVNMYQELRGPLGMSCPSKHYVVKQRVRVRTRPATDWNAASSITFDRAAGPGVRSGKFVSLDVTPHEPPSIPSDNCVTMHVFPTSPLELLPLNDGRWTQPGFGYAIELPASGALAWRDYTLDTYNHGNPSPGPANAFSNWDIRVELR